MRLQSLLERMGYPQKHFFPSGACIAGVPSTLCNPSKVSHISNCSGALLLKAAPHTHPCEPPAVQCQAGGRPSHQVHAAVDKQAGQRIQTGRSWV